MRPMVKQNMLAAQMIPIQANPSEFFMESVKARCSSKRSKPSADYENKIKWASTQPNA